MKSFKSTKNCNWLILFLFLSFSAIAQAKPVALVSSIHGDVFYSYQGVTKQLRLGMHIPSGAEVFGELGSQLTITDYYDHRYHMASSGHIKMTDNKITLLSGYIWVQSFQTGTEATIETANSVVGYVKGDGIVSFDSVAGKTQLLVVSGDFSFANYLNRTLKTGVYEGQFSYITEESEAPRKPTFCGFDSFKKVVSLFGGVKPMEEGAMARMQRTATPTVKKSSRSIASVTPKATAHTSVSEGTLTMRLTHTPRGSRVPASVSADKSQDKYIAAFYTDQLNKLKKMPTRPKKGRTIANKHKKIKINIFNGSDMRIKKSSPAMKKWDVDKPKTVRGPASVTPSKDTVLSPFDNSLNRQMKAQTRHPEEINQLIDELNSYDQDFDKSY